MYDVLSSGGRPGRIISIAVAGQAGAGKSTLAKELRDYWAGQDGVPVAMLGIDRYFKLPSKKRKQWIEEGERIGCEEYLHRSDNLSWFDFDRFSADMTSLRQGKALRLRNAYDKQTGELVASVDIEPADSGLVVVSDGVFQLHLDPLLFDSVVYVHADGPVRKARIQERDGHRKSAADLEKRWQETQRSEIPYVARYLQNAHLFVDTTSEPPALLSTFPPTQEIVQRARG